MSLERETKIVLRLRGRRLQAGGGECLCVEQDGAVQGQPGTRGKNRAGDASSKGEAAPSWKGSGAGGLITSHHLARGAEVFPS